MNAETNPHLLSAQLPLFDVPPKAASTLAPPLEQRPVSVVRRTTVSPHLLAATRLSRQIRRLRDHSPEETQTGLAICRALKAYLEDQADRTH